jgi:hypothetical protein|tara:strand:+ start:212 stop:1936 length:1725 start_codon:yes stop_codon:yes gene_type:complete
MLRKKVNIISAKYTAGELYKDYKEGRIVILSKWLQRLLRKSKWEASKWKSVREYNDAFFNGESNLQPFYVVPIDALLSQVQQDMDYVVKELSKKAYKEIVKSLKEAKSNGAEDVLLDGQNRLVVAIVPFFNSKMGKEELVEIDKDAMEKLHDSQKDLWEKLQEVTDEDFRHERKTYRVVPLSDRTQAYEVKWENYYDYPNGFIYENEDDDPVILNNFQFNDLSEEQQELFWKTEVDLKICTEGKLSNIVKSLVNLNKNNSWSEVEHALIECLPLPYMVNDMIFENPFCTSLFGNLDTGKSTLNGNVKDMDGNYALEVKGHGRFLTEITYFATKDGNSGFGSDATSCELLRASAEDTVGLLAFQDRVAPFIEFLSEGYGCPLPENSNLTKAKKPFTKEFIRTLFIAVNILTNKQHPFHNLSEIRVPKGLDKFVMRKQFIDDVLDWHNGKKDPHTTPEDFDGNTPKEHTYAATTTSLAKDAVMKRSHYIKEFINSKKDKWSDGNYFDSLVSYKKLKESTFQKSNGLDHWTARQRTRRDDNVLEHRLAKKGPNKGTDSPDNIVLSTERPNLIKSNKV